MRCDEITYVIEDLDAIEPGTSSDGLVFYDEARASGSKDLRRNYSAGYLSPDDALWNLRRHAYTGTEFRWELHASKTDVDLVRKARCNCHDLTPEKKYPERGDLRKHHSAETDKWSLKPGSTHELRKHSSDDSRMARGTTLQVPEVLPNPRPRCTCPKGKAPSASSISPECQDTEKKLHYSKSLTPEEMSPSLALKKHASEGSKIENTGTTKKSLRARWAGKTHFSLPAERKEPKHHKDTKSKSLKERHKYSVRRSISPDPDPRQIIRLDSRIVKRLISPEVSLANAKWAPYEGYSPLPNVGIRKRETKHISEIKWTPCDTSPSKSEDEDKDPFQNVTPTHHPPPQASPQNQVDDEEQRWRFLNMISPFPIYQGAWRDDTPPATPPPRQVSPQLWSPQKPPEEALTETPKPVTQPKKRSIMKAVRKKSSRAKSESTRFSLDTSFVEIPSRAASEEPKGRQRPQLMRSKALLEVPFNATKRSMSEEVPRNKSTRRTSRVLKSRAKSEEVSKYGDPWFAGQVDVGELRQYVTTV